MSKYFKKNKVISLLLVFTLVFGLAFSSGVSVNAATSNINSSGGTGNSKVATTISPAVFSVTVPYVLPISIDKDQNVSVATNANITNNSNGPIKVKSAEVTATDDWKLVSSDTDFNSVPVNSKQFSLKMMSAAVTTSGDVDATLFSSIDGNSSLNVSYEADAAVQSEAVTSENIANTVFTVEWDNVEINTATFSKSALKNFTKSLTTFQRTSDRLNIDDVKAMSNIVRLDDKTTDKIIYGWKDSNYRGYWWSNAMITYLPTDSSGLFQSLNIWAIDLSNIDTSNVTNMRNMFVGCPYLNTIICTDFDTSNVTNMSSMFEKCPSLKSLDLSSFDTSNVTNMSNMFSMSNTAISQIMTSLDLSSFDTSNVTNMSGMFYQCKGLTSLNISSFDLSSVKNIGNMFYGCSSLESINLSNVNTTNLTNMRNLFSGCSSLKTLDLSSFNTSNVIDMGYMFYKCSNLTTINLSSFNTSNVCSMDYMFSGCSSLKSLDLSNFDTSKVNFMNCLFNGCSNLETLDISSFNTSNVGNTACMFQNCSNLNRIYASYFNTDEISYSNDMFNDCLNLVGGNGTTYDSSYTDKTYARIDTPETPGYFTYKAKAA
jgi:surface protein